MVKNIALKISYFGKNYHGWQKQKDFPTVQGEIEKAIERLTGERVRLIGSSRTDAGVHAIGQVANFHTMSSIPPQQMKYALNSLLPDDIRILEAKEMPMSFSSRARRRKTYRYYIVFGDKNPFLKDFFLFIKRELNIEKMMECAKEIELVGRGKFSVEGFIENVYSSKIFFFPSSQFFFPFPFPLTDVLVYEITAEKFLRYSVRNIVGTLILVGLEKLSVSDFKEILYGRDFPFFTAPPCGLYLIDIKFFDFDF